MTETPDDPKDNVVDFKVSKTLPKSPGAGKKSKSANGAAAAEAGKDHADATGALRNRAIDAVLAAGVTFFHDRRRVGYASVPRAGHIEHYRVKGSAFRHVVRIIFGEKNQLPRPGGGTRPDSLSDAVVADVVVALETFAISSATRPAELRSLREGDAIWIDLGDETWLAVRASAAGWEGVAAADVLLFRTDTTQPLPAPARTPAEARPAILERLRRLLNLPDQDALMLAVAWMVAALWPSGPYPVLAIDGEQGSAKSSTARMLRRLTDPSLADLRAMPRTEEDLLIAGENGRVIGIDNVSHIAAEMADALCRVATGTGLGKRRQYTDGEEYVSALSRPVLLNGIPSLLSRGDLADRALAITLPAIPETQRRAEADLAEDFAALSPAILGLLLDGMAAAMHTLPTLKLPVLPRMADFARLSYAAAPAFGWTGEAMLACLERNRHAAAGATLDTPFGEALMKLAEERGEWHGSAADLLKALASDAPQDAGKHRAWPKDAQSLSKVLRRIRPAMQSQGVEVGFSREGKAGSRLISLLQSTKNRELLSALSANTEAGGNHGFAADSRDHSLLSTPVSPVSPTPTADSKPAAADSKNSPAVGHNQLKTNVADRADRADSDSTTPPRDGEVL